MERISLLHEYPSKEVFFMKGYVTASGYMGYVENEYILFASEDDYFEYVDSLNF
jgi:hypothetical protein